MPTNADLLARRVRAVPRGVATTHPIFAARAENGELWDVEGARFIDFAGGIATLNTGHRHPRIMAAVERQLALYTHTAFQVAAYEPYIALAERLNALAPFSGDAKTILFTTGAEATENAVKIARAATGRSGVIAFAGGFHGRTMMTMAMTGKVLPYKRLFGPLPGEVFHLPFPVIEHGVSVQDSLRALEFLFRADVEPARVAAIIIEPVLGEGGFYPAPQELLAQLRQTCDRYGIVLIADEVQTGFARTGRMFAIEHSLVQPDLVTVAKSMAGGFPLSGVIGRASLMDAAEPGGLGGTFAGNPVACAAALAVLDVIAEEDLCARARELGVRVKRRLEAIAVRNDVPPITAVRGDGAMIAFDIVKERGDYEPDAAAAKRVVEAALREHVMLLSCGIYANGIRLLMPLTVPFDVLEEGLDGLERALIAART
jgi:4-aminobutyrate aminotransferase / (S)-3-amino-2-methylpropionate transaminase / 5-aminovalerate transaminase